MPTDTLDNSKVFRKRARTPSKAPKRPYWRADVITVVNNLLGYSFVRPEGQDWFWTDEWQTRVERSVAEINEGHGEVDPDNDSFLAALGA